MMDEPTLLILTPGRIGRPPRAGETAAKQIHILVTEQEHAELCDVAKQEQRPLSAVVRDAVNSYVGDYSERRIFESRRAAAKLRTK
jgi:hypothetical protein